MMNTDTFEYGAYYISSLFQYEHRKQRHSNTLKAVITSRLSETLKVKYGKKIETAQVNDNMNGF